MRKVPVACDTKPGLHVNNSRKYQASFTRTQQLTLRTTMLTLVPASFTSMSGSASFQTSHALNEAVQDCDNSKNSRDR
jgi:hypothetical protein